MKKLTIVFIYILFNYLSIAYGQDSTHNVFWKEDFSTGKLPAGWENVALNDSSSTWFVTDQPYPGSYGRNYQAPPISSESGGYFLQIAPGVRVDKNIRKWKKAGIVPNAYIQTPAIDCSQKSSVILTFQQNFFWGEWEKQGLKAGLMVGVSHDKKNWTFYDVHNGIGSATDCPNPMNVELNITRVAAGEKTVYLRFWWRNMYQWYWMIDDIALSEGPEKDLQSLDMGGRKSTGNVFQTNDSLVFRVVNLGAKPVTQPVRCFLKIDNRPLKETTITASRRHPIGVIDTVGVVFPDLDLTNVGLHKVVFYTTMAGDERQSNDTIRRELYSKACSVGNITGFKASGNHFSINCDHAHFRVQILRDDIFRIWMAYDGDFTNPAGDEIVIHTPTDTVNADWSDQESYYLIKTPLFALRAYKQPLHFSLYRGDNKTLVWEETRGITYGKETIQYLKRGVREQFFGGGMQNGRFSHRGKTIKLDIDYNWKDGGNPNPATFYMSTKGYGAM